MTDDNLVIKTYSGNINYYLIDKCPEFVKNIAILFD